MSDCVHLYGLICYAGSKGKIIVPLKKNSLLKRTKSDTGAVSPVELCVCNIISLQVVITLRTFLLVKITKLIKTKISIYNKKETYFNIFFFFKQF